jgi:very-short-patch-repair endonuclease
MLEAIRLRLVEAGIEPRDRSAGQSNRLRLMSPEARLALSDKAHSAVRGVSQSEEHRCKIALGVERKGLVVSPKDKTLKEWLEGLGVDTVPLKAVGRYNVDIALTESRVAVEIFGGHWHMVGRHAARYRKRFDYLLDRGWLPVVVWVTTSYRLSYAVADQIFAWHEGRRAGETFRRQEHVIRGDGYVAAVDQIDPDNGAIVMGFNPGNDQRGDDGRFR